MNKSDIALFEGLQGQTFLNGYNYDDDYCLVMIDTSQDRPFLCGYVLTDRPMPSGVRSIPSSFAFLWLAFYEQVDGKTCLGFKTFYSHHVDPNETLAPVVIGAMLEYASMVSALTLRFAHEVRLAYPVASDNLQPPHVDKWTIEGMSAMQQTIIDAIKPYCTMDVPND